MITISTYLHPGIYASDGGGQTTVHYRWETGPRNLIAAIRCLRKHREQMTQGYGNIGHGASWIEIDGQRIGDIHIDHLERHDVETLSDHERRAWRRGDRYGLGPVRSPHQKARRLLDTMRREPAHAT